MHAHGNSCTHTQVSGQEIIDIGCGQGVPTRQLEVAAGRMTAVDAAPQVMRNLPLNIRRLAARLPRLPLKENLFDGVVCTDVLAELPPGHYVLAMDELARLIRPSGWLLASTPLDSRTPDALERFLY